jgi:hypothetical protein
MPPSNKSHIPSIRYAPFKLIMGANLGFFPLEIPGICSKSNGIAAEEFLTASEVPSQMNEASPRLRSCSEMASRMAPTTGERNSSCGTSPPRSWASWRNLRGTRCREKLGCCNELWRFIGRVDRRSI